MLAPLAGNPNVLEKDPSSLINVTLNGTEDLVIGGISAPYPMPKYAPVLNDQQIADVLTFVRAGWNNGGSAVTVGGVGKKRKTTKAARSTGVWGSDGGGHQVAFVRRNKPS